MTTYATPHDEAPEITRTCAFSGMCGEGCDDDEDCALACKACHGGGRMRCGRCAGSGEPSTGRVGVGRCRGCKGLGEVACDSCAGAT